jgi:putative transposase
MPSSLCRADELRVGLSQLLRKARMEHDADVKEGVRVLSQGALAGLDGGRGRTACGRHERTEGRSGHRNGYWERSRDTIRVAAVDLLVPRVRDGSYLPSLLQPCRRAERALSAVVREANVHGVSTRKVDDLV